MDFVVVSRVALVSGPDFGDGGELDVLVDDVLKITQHHGWPTDDDFSTAAAFRVYPNLHHWRRVTDRIAGVGANADDAVARPARFGESVDIHHGKVRVRRESAFQQVGR